MCEPTTILAVASAASAAAGLVGQQQAASAQEKANQRQYEASVIARNENAAQVELARVQHTEDATNKVLDNNRNMRAAQATAVSQAGPTGLSMDALLGGMAGMGARYNDSVSANLQRTNMALDNQLVNVNRNAASEINSLKRPETPDYLGTALKIGTSLNKGGIWT